MKALSFVVAAALLAAILPAQLNPCQFRRIDPTCGPRLVGHDNIITVFGKPGHLIGFDVTGAPANSVGVLAFGFKQIKKQFPGTRCFLLIDAMPQLAVPFHTNPMGHAGQKFFVPGKLVGRFFAQSGFVHGRRLTTSNALAVKCQ